MFIDDYSTLIVEFDLQIFETQALRIRLTSGCKHKLVRLERDPSSESCSYALRCLFNRLDLLGEEQIDPFFSHLVGQGLAHVVIKSSEKQRAAMDKGDSRAHAVKNAGEFDADIAAAHDNDAFRKSGKIKGLIRGHCMLRAGDGGLRRPAAGGDKNIACRVPSLVYLNGVRIQNPGTSVDDLNPGLLEHAPVHSVEPLYLGVLVGDELPPVDTALPYRPAEARRVLKILAEVGGVHEERFRNAADVDTGASELSLLRDRYLSAVQGRDTAGSHSARPSPYREKVVIIFLHFRQHSPCLFSQP